MRHTKTFGPLLPRLTTAAALVGLLYAAPAALGQDGPTTRPPEEGGVRSPFWEGDRGYDRSRDRGRYEEEASFAERFPVDLAARVAPARERYVALKLSYDMARRSLDDRVDDLRRSLRESEEYRQLAQEREEIERSLQSSREQAIAPLLDDPQYQALLDLEQDLARQIKAAHAAPDRDLEEIRGMSELAMIYGRQRREMEAGLVQNDANMDSAMQRLREVNTRQRELDAELSRRVRGDEDLLALRGEIDQLRVAYISAREFYDSTVRTADIAAEFAYYDALARSPYAMGRYDRHAQGYGYPYGGYGFGRHFGGIVIGGFPVSPSDGGPIRMRPVLYPTPIFSNTWRGVNSVYNPLPGAPGGSPPEIPEPGE